MQINTKVTAKFNRNEVISTDDFINFLNDLDDDDFNALSILFYDELNVDLESLYDDVNRIRDYMRANEI